MKVDINNIIYEVDSKIKNYASVFNWQKNRFYRETNNQPNILYERTLSSITNLFLYEVLSSEKIKIFISVNEYQIFFKNGITTTEFSNLKQDVDIKPGLKGDRSMWNYCAVDGYFLISTDASNQLHIFLEYKLKEDLIFIDLAADYLKYKAYTFRSNIDSIFCFIIFDKNDSYPTILSKPYPYFQEINSTISSSMLLDKRVYIHKNIGVSKSSIDHHPYNVTSLENAITQFANLSKISKELIQNKKYIELKSNKNIFIDSMKKFNKKVINARTIRNNYDFIANLWDKTDKLKMFNDVYKAFKVSSKEQLTDEIIINEGSHYIQCFEESTSMEDKAKAMENALRVTSFSSLKMIILLDYFNDLFEVDKGLKPIYREVELGRRTTRKRTVKYETTAKNQKEIIDKHYGDDPEKREKVMKLAYSIMYYIINLYPELYEIKDNKVGDIKDSYKTLLLVDNFNSNMKKIEKMFKYKNRKIRLERSLEDVDKLLPDLFSHIVKEIEPHKN